MTFQQYLSRYYPSASERREETMQEAGQEYADMRVQQAIQSVCEDAGLQAADPGMEQALKLLLFAIKKCDESPYYALPLQVLKAAEEAAEVLRGAN